MKIAVFAAFPRELSSLCKNSVHAATSRDGTGRIYLDRHLNCDIIAAETGVCTASVEAVFKHVVRTYRPDAVLSIGFAGALYYRVDIGDLVIASRYVVLTHEGVVELPQLSYRNPAAANSSFLDERVVKGVLQKIRIKEGSIVTLSGLMAKSQLRRLLPDDLPLPVYDRQSMHLAKLCCKNRLPFFAVRSITELLDQDVPGELSDIINSEGNYTLSVIRAKPSLIPLGLKIGRNSGLASKNLCQAVKAMIEVLSLLHARYSRFPGAIRFSRK